MGSPSRSVIGFALNGHLQTVDGDDAAMMLADYLRRRAGLTGTKVVCAEGDCGACTVLRARPPRKASDPWRFEAINACITLVAQMDGCALITIEGLGPGDTMTPVQEAMVKCHGSQCGYCTPGFVMALTGFMEKCRERNCPPTPASVKNALTGNLCRCTGYTPIVEAANAVTPDDKSSLSERFVTAPMQRRLRSLHKQPIQLDWSGGKFWAPLTLEEAARLRQKYPEAAILASSTDFGVMVNKGKKSVGHGISLHLIPDLDRIQRRGNTLTVGARATLEQVRQACVELIPEFSHLLDVFASPQIKHTATLVGNIANGSPIGDTLPFLLVADGTVMVTSSRRERVIPLMEFYRGYRTLDLKSGEVIRSVSFRIPHPQEHLKLFKAAARKDLDIAAANGAFLMDIPATSGTPVIRNARIALGGVAAVPLRLTAVEDYLRGKPCKPEILDEAEHLMQEAINPISDVRGSAAYRRVLVRNFWRQYQHHLLTGGPTPP